MIRCWNTMPILIRDSPLVDFVKNLGYLAINDCQMWWLTESWCKTFRNRNIRGLGKFYEMVANGAPFAVPGPLRHRLIFKN